MNRIPKATIGAVMFMSLFLTACGSDVPSDKNPKPYAGATSSASASAAPSAGTNTYAPVDPSATSKPTLTASPEEAKAIQEAAAKNPMGINVEEAFEKHGDPMIDEIFPKGDFDTKEGVRFGLETIGKIVNSQEFYLARDGSKDWELLNVEGKADRFTAELRDDVEKSITQSGRVIFMPNADAKGSLGYYGNDEANQINPVDTGIPENRWGTPSVAAGFDKEMNTNAIIITGQRTMIVQNENNPDTRTEGEVVQVDQNYTVSVVPSGEGQWLVSYIDFAVTGTKVLNG